MRFDMIVSLIVDNLLVSLLMVIYLASEVANAGIDGAIVRIVLLLLTVIFSAWFSRIFSLIDIVRILTRVFLFIILAHFIILLVIGTPYVADELNRDTLLGVGAQSGLFPHKNYAGMVFSIATIVFVSNYFYLPARRWVALAGAIASISFLLLVGATGAVVITLAGLGVIVSFLALNKFWSFILCVFASIVILPFIFLDENVIFELLGRNDTLTGRTVIWSLWPEFFSEHPWIGLGYSGFFNPGGPALRLWDQLPDKYQAVNFHNSFLDVGIQTGILGISLIVLIAVVGLWRSAMVAINVGHRHSVVPLSLILPLILFATIESAVPAHNNFATVIFFIMYFKSTDLYNSYYFSSQRSIQNRTWRSNLSSAARTTRRYRRGVGWK